MAVMIDECERCGVRLNGFQADICGDCIERERRLTAVTHGGVFHADDVLAAAILRLANPEIRIVRTNNPGAQAAAGITFDVGGGAYDHHQRGGNGARPNGIKYAACGLIWRAFGPSAIVAVERDLALNIEAVHARVDETLIQSVDAQDNGQRPPAGPLHQEISLSDALGLLNPSWHERQDFDAAFFAAVEIAVALLRRAIIGAVGQVKAEAKVAQAIADAADPRIVVLDRFLPWQRPIAEGAPDALYIVFPSQRDGWSAQAVPTTPGGQVSRKPFPPSWRVGPDPAALRAASGIEGLTFGHTGGFFISGETREAVIAACHRAADA